MTTMYGFNENQTQQGYVQPGFTTYEYELKENGSLTINNDLSSDFGPVLNGHLEAAKDGEPSIFDDMEQLTFIQALLHIKQNEDVTPKESNYLDQINSRFIGHHNYRDFTPRDSLCAFLDQFYDWSNVYQDQRTNEGTTIKSRDLFQAYNRWCDKVGIRTRPNRMTEKEIKDYFKLNGYRETRDDKGKVVITNLPPLKNNIVVPKFIEERVINLRLESFENVSLDQYIYEHEDIF